MGDCEDDLYTALTGVSSTRWVLKSTLNHMDDIHGSGANANSISHKKWDFNKDLKQSHVHSNRCSDELLRASVSDFVNFFAPFAPSKNRAAMHVSADSDKNLLSSKVALGTICCHPVQFSLFSDFVVSEVTGYSAAISDSSTSKLVPTLAVGASRGTMLVQLDADNATEKSGPTNLSRLVFRLINASDSKNLIPCRGGRSHGSGASQGSGNSNGNDTECKMLCRVLAEDEVRGPIERHDCDVFTPTFRMQPTVSISSVGASPKLLDDGPTYRTGDVLMSGWMTKWPMRSQFLGTSTKRFFLLLAAHRKSASATAVLAYWTSPPNCLSYMDFRESATHLIHQSSGNVESYHDEDSAVRATVMSPNGLQDLLDRDAEIPMHTAKGQLVLDANSCVRIMKSSLFGSRYLEITTSSDSMCVECSSADTELSWFSKLSAVMNYQRMVTVLQFPNRKLYALKNSPNSNAAELVYTLNCEISMSHLDVLTYFSPIIVSPSLCLSTINSNFTSFMEAAADLGVSVGKKSKQKNGEKLDLTQAKNGFSIAKGLRTTVTVLEVAVDESVLMSVPGQAAIKVAKAKNSDLQMNNSSRSTSIAATSIEDPLTPSASPSDRFIFGQTPSQSLVGKSMTNNPLPDNREFVRSKAPAVSVDSGVDMDETMDSSSTLTNCNKHITTANLIVAEIPQGPATGLPNSKLTTLLLTFQSEEMTDHSGKAIPDGGDEYGRHYIHFMDGSNISYVLTADVRFLGETFKSTGHSRETFSLKHLAHCSSRVVPSAPNSLPNDIHVRLLAVAGAKGYVGVGFTAVCNSVTRSAGGIKREVKRPLNVELANSSAHYPSVESEELVNEEAVSGRESFSSIVSDPSKPMTISATIPGVNVHCSKTPIINLVHLSGTTDADSERINSSFNILGAERCLSREIYEDGITATEPIWNDMRGEDAHSNDSNITAVALCSGIDCVDSRCGVATCGTYPCVYCTQVEGQSTGAVYSQSQSSVLVSADDVGTLCIWQLVSLSTVLITTALKSNSTPKQRKEKKKRNKNDADIIFEDRSCDNICASFKTSVKVRVKHRLAHRIVMGVPITSIDVSPDGAYLSVCTVTQALLFEITSEPVAAYASNRDMLPRLRLRLASILDDCTNKNVLFRHRYVTDLRSSPGHVWLWKMCTFHDSDKSSGNENRSNNLFQFSDLDIKECMNSTVQTLRTLWNRQLPSSAEEKSSKGLPLISIQEYISWLGNGFGVVSACHTHRANLQDMAMGSSDGISSDKWSMDDFEEYIRLRNRVKKWWRENSSRVLILHEKTRDTQQGSNADAIASDKEMALNIAVNKALLVPPGGACGQPMPTAHTCGPVLAQNAYHHSFLTESTRNAPMSPRTSAYDESVRSRGDVRQILLQPPPYFSASNLLDEKIVIKDNNITIATPLSSSRYRALLRNGPEGVDFASPLFSAAVTKEFRGHCLLKCVLQTADNNSFYKCLGEKALSNESVDMDIVRFAEYDELCAFEMLCSLVFQLFESFGGEYIDSLKLVLQAELSEELTKLLNAKPLGDEDDMTTILGVRVPSTSPALKTKSDGSIFKLSNYLDVHAEDGVKKCIAQRDSFSHLINGIVARIHTIPSLSLGQLDDLVTELNSYLESCSGLDTTSLGNMNSSEINCAVSLKVYLEKIRNLVFVLGNEESGLFFPVMSDLMQIPLSAQSFFNAFASESKCIPEHSLAVCTKRILDTFLISALANMERVAHIEIPLSLVIAISGFDHSQSPNLIRLVHNQGAPKKDRSDSAGGDISYGENGITPLTADALKWKEHEVMKRDADDLAKSINDPVMLGSQGGIDKSGSNFAANPNLGVSPTLAVYSPRQNNDSIKHQIIIPAASSFPSDTTGQKAIGSEERIPKPGCNDNKSLPASQLFLISELIQRSPSWVRYVLSSRNKADQTQERSVLLSNSTILPRKR